MYLCALYVSHTTTTMNNYFNYEMETNKQTNKNEIS